MKLPIFSAAAALSGALVFTACDRKAPFPASAQPKAAAEAVATDDAPSGTSDKSAGEAAALAALEREGMELAAQERLLQQQLKNESLAAELAALEQESAALEREQAAWLQELTSGHPDEDAAASDAPAEDPATEDYQLFYDELEPYGRWFGVPDYGYVWQPTAAYYESSGWHPCTIGEWAWSDGGWTWISDEPFGWAVYHYGRWAYLRGCGWIWVPGSQWAPAWVAWRRSKTHVGWCPLPPEAVFDCDSEIDTVCGICPDHYVFVPVQKFCGPVHDHCEPAHRSGEFCRNSVNVTRLNTGGKHGACGGPAYEWLCKHVTRRPQRCTLVCEPERRRTGPHDCRPRRENDRLCVFTPRVEAPWNRMLRPERLAESPKTAEIVRSKTGLPEKTVRRFADHVRVRRDAASKALSSGRGAQILERQNRLASTRADVERRHAALAADVPPPVAAPPPAKGVTAAVRREQIETARRTVAGKQQELANLRAARGGAPSTVTSGTRSRSAEPASAPTHRDSTTATVIAPSPDKPTPGVIGQPTPNERTSRDETAQQRALQQAQPVQQQQEQARRLQQQSDEAAKLAARQNTAQQTAAIHSRRQQEVEQQTARELAARQQQLQAALDAGRREEAERIRKTEEAKAQLARQQETMTAERQRRETIARTQADHDAKEQAAARQRELIAHQQQQRAAEQRAREVEQARQDSLRQREIAETQRREVMERARAEEQAREEAARLQAMREQQQQREAQERSRREQNEQQEAARQREVAENQRRESIERARAEHEANERSKREAEAQRRHAEENARRTAEEQSRKAAEAAERAARDDDARKNHDRKK